jgi:hypothetical protein
LGALAADRDCIQQGSVIAVAAVDPIAEYLAAGGQIKRCPTVCLVSTTGCHRPWISASWPNATTPGKRLAIDYAPKDGGGPQWPSSTTQARGHWIP